MKLKLPAKEVEVCDSCSRDGYLQTCIVCGAKYCLVCHAIIPGCVHTVDCCKKCSQDETVLAVVNKFVPRLVRVLRARNAELAGVGGVVKKARRARETQAQNPKLSDPAGTGGRPMTEGASKPAGFAGASG